MAKPEEEARRLLQQKGYQELSEPAKRLADAAIAALDAQVGGIGKGDISLHDETIRKFVEKHQDSGGIL